MSGRRAAKVIAWIAGAIVALFLLLLGAVALSLTT